MILAGVGGYLLDTEEVSFGCLVNRSSRATCFTELAHQSNV